MKKYVIVYSSASVVHRAKKLLKKEGVRVQVVQLPSDLGLKGCSYGLECEVHQFETVLAHAKANELAVKAAFLVEQADGGKVYTAYDLS